MLSLGSISLELGHFLFTHLNIRLLCLHWAPHPHPALSTRFISSVPPCITWQILFEYRLCAMISVHWLLAHHTVLLLTLYFFQFPHTFYICLTTPSILTWFRRATPVPTVALQNNSTGRIACLPSDVGRRSEKQNKELWEMLCINSELQRCFQESQWRTVNDDRKLSLLYFRNKKWQCSLKFLQTDRWIEPKQLKNKC